MNAHQRRKEQRKLERVNKCVNKLLADFPSATEDQVCFFASQPNSFVDGKMPHTLTDYEKVKSLFEQYLHPSEVF